MTAQPNTKSHDVTWDVNGMQVYGTLTRPSDKQTHPGATRTR